MSQSLLYKHVVPLLFGPDISLYKGVFPFFYLAHCNIIHFCLLHVSIYIYIYIYIQGVPGGMCQTSGGCSLGQTIPI